MPNPIGYLSVVVMTEMRRARRKQTMSVPCASQEVVVNSWQQYIKLARHSKVMVTRWQQFNLQHADQ